MKHSDVPVVTGVPLTARPRLVIPCSRTVLRCCVTACLREILRSETLKCLLAAVSVYVSAWVTQWQLKVRHCSCHPAALRVACSWKAFGGINGWKWIEFRGMYYSWKTTGSRAWLGLGYFLDLVNNDFHPTHESPHNFSLHLLAVINLSVVLLLIVFQLVILCTTPLPRWCDKGLPKRREAMVTQHTMYRPEMLYEIP